MVPLIGVLLFLAAFRVLHDEISKISFAELRGALQAIPPSSLFLACLAVFANYAVLTLSDAIAVRQSGARIPYPHVALISFISNAIGFNVGMSILTGGSVRYRLYSSFGLSTLQIAGVVAMCHITLTLGMWTAAGIALLFEPAGAFVRMGWPAAIPRLIGLAALALPVAVFAVSARIKRGHAAGPPWFGGKIFSKFDPASAPGPATLARQLAVGVLDPLLASMVLFCLLPEGRADMPVVCGAYIVALMAGAISQVPGGLGVFEVTMIWQLSAFYGRGELLGAILLYRVVYYIAPLVAASLLLFGFELSENLRRYVRGLPKLLPAAISLWTFFAGVSLVFAGVVPPHHERLKELHKLVSLPMLELSHFSGSILGTALLFLAWGLARRLRSAWTASVAALAAAMFFSFASGLRYENVEFLLPLLLILLLCRKSFYRLSFFSTFDAKWALMIAVVLFVAIRIGFFAYRHVEYSNELWWHFAFTAGAPRFLRATLGTSVAFVAFTLWLWLRPSPLRANAPLAEADIERIVTESPASDAALALLGDKKFFTSSDCDCAIMYAAAGGFWISMGDPIGREEYAGDLIWQFCEEADRRGAKPVFYETGERWVDVYRDNGLHVSPLGEEARVDLVSMTPDLSGGTWKSLRPVRRKLTEEGCSFRVLDGEARDAALPRLRAISDQWLDSVHGAEKGFSLGFFDEAYLRHFPVAVVEKDGAICAFCNLWLGAEPSREGERRELSVDLMRYAKSAPESVMSYLFLEAMLWGKAQGFGCFRLGMAPLSNMNPDESLWERAGDFVYRHGEIIYNFKGVRHYKEKFHPEWTPSYLAYPDATSLPLLLAQLVRVIS